MTRIFAELRHEPEASNLGRQVMQRVFAQRLSRLGTLKALLHTLACPPIAVALLENNAGLQQLAMDPVQWHAYPDKHKTLGHVQQILSLLDAAIYGHSSLGNYLDATNRAHQDLTVTLPRRIGTWPATTYRVMMPELMLFVLAEFLLSPLEAYEQRVNRLSDDDKQYYVAAVLDWLAPALNIDLAGVDLPSTRFEDSYQLLQQWLEHYEVNLCTTPPALNMATNLFASKWPNDYVLGDSNAPVDLGALVSSMLAHRVVGTGGYKITYGGLQETTLNAYVRTHTMLLDK